MKKLRPLPLLLDILIAIADAIRTTIIARRAEREIARIMRDCERYMDSSMMRPTPPPDNEKWIDEVELKITR